MFHIGLGLNKRLKKYGGTLNDFELSTLDYDEDKHFFLAQYFRDQYDEALTNYPFIKSQVQITRLEVWVTNRGQQTLNVRNIVAIQDLGEALKEKTRIGIANHVNRQFELRFACFHQLGPCVFP